MEDYTRRIEEVKEMVLGYASQSWPIIKTSHGVEISCHQYPDIPVKVYKAVGEVNAPPSLTFEYAVPGPLRGKWDKAVKVWERVKELDERTFILHSVSHSAAMGLISPREYVDLVRFEKNFDGGKYCSFAAGYDYPYPEDPTLVRGQNYPSGILCFPVENDPNRTRLVSMIHSDLKGYLPHRLIESTLPSVQVSYYTNLRKAIIDKVHEKAKC